MNNIIPKLIQHTTSALIPIPEIFAIMDTTSSEYFYLSNYQEEALITYLQSKTEGKNIDSKYQNKIQDKLILINEILEVLWIKREEIRDQLNKFTKINQGLIQLLNEHNQHKSLQIIEKFDGVQSYQWKQYKLQYYKLALQQALEKEQVEPEFIYAIHFNEESQNYSIIYNKKVKTILKKLEYYQQVTIYWEMDDKALIMNILTLLGEKHKKEVCQIFLHDKENRIFKQVRELNDPISKEIQKLFGIRKNRRADDAGFQYYKDQLYRHYSFMYLDYGIKNQIPIPEYLTCFRHKPTEMKQLSIIPSMYTFDAITKYDKLSKINKYFNLEHFLYTRNQCPTEQLKQNYNDLVQIYPIETKAKLIEQQIYDMLQLIYDQKESELEKLVNIAQDQRVKEFIDKFTKNYSRETELFSKSRIIVLKIKEFIEQSRLNGLQEFKNRESYVDLYSQYKKQQYVNAINSRDISLMADERRNLIFNALQVLKHLLQNQQIYPGFMKYIKIQTSSRNNQKTFVSCRFYFSIDVLQYMIETEGIYEYLKKQSNGDVKNYLIKQSIQNHGQEDLIKFKQPQMAYELIKSSYEKRDELKEEIIKVLETQQVKQFIVFLECEMSKIDRPLCVLSKIRVYLRDLYEYFKIDYNQDLQIEDDY